MISKRFLIFAFLLFVIFSISGIYAEYKESNPSYYYNSFKTSNSFFGANEFYGNMDYCNESQDFLLQISPLSCTPAVVRSDLLEEQDVPVFCPLTSIKLNPLIKVETIESINFGKQYDPQAISGIGFHPYRGALSTSRTSLMNENANAVYNDQIGYIVVWLRNNKNESSMPDYVSGNISANLRYNAENVFGLKGNSFYLPVLTDEDWQKSMDRYSFWEGKGYLRAEEILSDKAEIALYSYTSQTYSGSDSSQKKLLFRTTLESGKTSNKFFLPGFGCNAGFKLQLEGTESPDSFVKLKINSEYLDVKEKEKFLDGNCYIKLDSLENYGLTKKVVLNCRSFFEEDKGGNILTNSFGGGKDYSLYVSPKFEISFNSPGTGSISKSLNVGDLITVASNDRKIFLAYVGMIEENNKEVMKALILSLPSSHNNVKLSDSELESAKNYVEYKERSILSYFGLKDEENIILSYGEDNKKVLSQLTFELKGFGKGEDSVLDDITEKDYENSFDEFGIVIDRHSGQKYPYNNTITLDKEAYQNEIILASSLNQKSKALSLCNEYEKNYPASYLDECKDKNKLLFSNSILIKTEKGETYTISLEDIYEPSFSDYGVELIVTNKETLKVDVLNLLKGKRTYIDQDKGYYVSLDKIIDEKNAQISYNLPDADLVSRIYAPTLTKDQSQDIGKFYKISIKKIYLKRYARVSIIPEQKYRETTANFNFKINIEKRNIQLAPEKIESKIQDLNKTIEKWNKISSGLGDFVKTMKTACLATEATLTVKHLLMDSGGKSIARTEVMKGKGGWNERCANAVAKGEYHKSLDECYYKNSAKIDAEVDLYSQKLSEQNKEIKGIQNKHISTPASLFGSKSIDTNNFTKDYSGEVKPTLTGTIQVQDPKYPDDPNKKINVSLTEYQKYLNYNSQNPYSIDDLKEIDLYNRLIGNSEGETQQIYEQKLYDVLNSVKSNSEAQSEQTKLTNKYGSEVTVAKLDDKKSNQIEIGQSEIKKFGNIKSQFDSNISLKDDSKVVPIHNVLGGGKEYLFELDNKNIVIGTYLINGRTISVYKGEDPSREKNPFDVVFKVLNSASYKNKYKTPQLRCYETEPYKGLPALVPFDLDNGWYAYIRQNLAVGSTIGSYDLSGKITSFEVCNVGKNGLEEFNSLGRDDICQVINKGIGQPYGSYHDLDEEEAKRLIANAENAIAQAYKSCSSKGKTVTIGKYNIEKGEPALNLPSTQCTDYMSPKECQLMFNVCDPVICPSSRCDFGGAYPVKDVVQSGIIGSLVLCLPNYREGIYIPVCLTGVKAGIDGWLSILDSYRGCLQENLETGSTIGICDEINSIYMCEFFWRQAFPIAKLAIPKIISLLAGQNSRGGGEYMGVQSAWQNAQNSLNYFTQNYALNSFNAFKYRSTEQVGADVCKSFVSLSYPAGGDILDQLTEPDSPAQFHGRFDEIPFSTVTNPPISHYKVFYHIYSGNDRGSYFRVYLRGGETGSSYYQSLDVGKMVASGYIGKGDYKTETLDFTAPSGFKELCINVNGDEECGFAQVSTSFVADYIKDQYIDSQVTQKDIKTENECISGTPNIYSLLNPNLQEGVGDLINPQLYNRGIVRICSTDYPGQTVGTDYGTNEQRWIEVGYCGDKTMKCWLDKDSAPNAFEFETNANKALEEVTDDYIKKMLSDPKYISPETFDNNVSLVNLMSDKTIDDKIKKLDFIDKLISQVFFVNEIGKLHLMKGIIYGDIAQEEYKSYLEKVKVEKIENAETEEFYSEWFDYDDGRRKLFNWNPDICFSYSNKVWKYFIGKCSGDSETVWISVKDKTSEDYVSLNDDGKNLIIALANSNYKKGVLVLVKETFKGKDVYTLADRTLRTKFTIMNEEGVFYFENNKVEYPQIIYAMYKDQFWMWSLSSSLNSDWLKTPKLAEKSEDENGVSAMLKEDHDEIIEHYEEIIIKDLGDSSMNLEKGSSYLFEGKFTIEVQEAIEKEEEIVTGEMNSCQQNVLSAMIKIYGENRDKIVDVDGNGINCYDSVAYIYNEAQVNPKCIYSDKEEKIYNVGGADLPATKNSNSATFIVNPNACENKDLSESDKLAILKPGYMLSVFYGYNSNQIPKAHSVIFVKWVDESNNLAQIFDWGAFSGSGIFEYSNLDLSDDAHPVYMFWKPTPKDGSCNEEEINTQETTIFDDKDYSSAVFELQDGTLSENICYRFYYQKWHWRTGCSVKDNIMHYSDSSTWIEVDDASKYTGLNLKDSVLMDKMKGENYYVDGLEILTNEIISGNRGSWFSDAELITVYASFNENNVLTLKSGGINSESRKKFQSPESIHFLYVNNEWFFSLSKGTYDQDDLDIFKNAKSTDGQIVEEDDIWRRPKYLKENSGILNNIEEEIINVIGNMDKEVGIAYLFGWDFNLPNLNDIPNEGSLPSTNEEPQSSTNEKIDSNGIYEVIKEVKITSISNGDENKKCNCGSDGDCKNLANYIIDSSIKEGISPYLILAVAMQESNCVADASSGKAFGIMQITEGSYEYYCEGKIGSNFNVLKSVPEKNIECGTKILNGKYREYKDGLSSSSSYYSSCSQDYPDWITYKDWNAALRGYNGWGCDPKTSDINYVENVNNLARELGSIGKCSIFEGFGEGSFGGGGAGGCW